jgi:hypothetical protein
MNRRRKSSYNTTTPKNKKIMRCRSKMIPVFESDNCKEFIKREKSDSNSICKNCKNSF